MKTALLAFLVSFSVMASECYVRTTELVTSEVTMAKEFCVNNIAVKIVGPYNSKAKIKYSLDGVATEKEMNLSNGFDLRNGKVLHFLYNFEANYAGGFCGDTFEAAINAELEMNKDGSEAKLINIKGSVSTSNDNCHSVMREIQSVPFILI